MYARYRSSLDGHMPRCCLIYLRRKTVTSRRSAVAEPAVAAAAAATAAAAAAAAAARTATTTQTKQPLRCCCGFQEYICYSSRTGYLFWRHWRRGRGRWRTCYRPFESRSRCKMHLLSDSRFRCQFRLCESMDTRTFF